MVHPLAAEHTAEDTWEEQSWGELGASPHRVFSGQRQGGRSYSAGENPAQEPTSCSEAALPQFTHPRHEEQDSTRLVEVEVKAAGVHGHRHGAHGRHRLLQRRLTAWGYQPDGRAVGRPVPGVVPAAGGVLRGGRVMPGLRPTTLLCPRPRGHPPSLTVAM